MFVKKDVVEEVDNPCTEMSLQMAREKLPHAQLGDVIRIECAPAISAASPPRPPAR